MNQEVIQGLSNLLNNSKIREGKTDFIKEIREKAELLEPHFENKYPGFLLNRQHPGEMPEMKLHRSSNWESPTIAATGRVQTSCQKIQQSDEFKIIWNESDLETGIVSENSLEKYCKDFVPKFGNLEDWTFSIYLRSLFEDANSVHLILPDLSDFIEFQDIPDWTLPYPQYFESEDIVYHKEKELIVKLEELEKDGSKYERYLAVTMQGLVLAVQVRPFNENENAFAFYPLEYEFVDFPVTISGQKIYELEDNSIIYDSFLAPCIPSWNKSLRRADDLEVNWQMHANPQYWRVKSSECKTCKGRGYTIIAKSNERTECSQCYGTGTGSDGSPFNQIEIALPKTSVTSPNAPNIPFPPAGYITRDSDAIKNLGTEVDDQIFKGFQAIGLELLSIVPAPQSGIAKQYDRKEINTFFYQVAIMIQYGYYNTAKLIYNLRYLGIANAAGLNEEKRMASLPKITIPSDFDILTMEMLAANLSMARKDQYNPVIISGMERDYVEKLYGEDSDELKLINVVSKLDPLPSKTVDEKVIIKDSMGCTEVDFVLSCYINSFINELIETNPDWLKKKLSDQRKDLVKLATEKQAEIKKSIVPINTRVEAFA
jgi:hypothetical protein